jgi:hypothetical protein
MLRKKEKEKKRSLMPNQSCVNLAHASPHREVDVKIFLMPL